MEQLKTPTLGQERQGLSLKRQNLKYSTKPKGSNHLKVLQSIATKWVEHGYYQTSDRAYRALIGGDL